MFISEDSGAHLSKWKAQQRQLWCDTALLGSCPLTMVPLPREHVGPACPSRHSEPTSLPPPMQQRWSGLLGSASGGSEESWEPGESGSRYCYTMPWTQSAWCFFKHDTRFPAQTLEALHSIWWKSEASPSEKGPERRMLKSVVCHQAFEDFLWAELSCWFLGYDVSPASAISSLLILNFAKLRLCLTLQRVEGDTAHCWTTLVSLWIDGHLSHHLTLFHSPFSSQNNLFRLAVTQMSNHELPVQFIRLGKAFPMRKLFLSSQTQFRDAPSAPCLQPWSPGPGSCCDHLAALGTCLQAGLLKLKIFLVFLGINSLNSTRKPHLVL